MSPNPVTDLAERVRKFYARREFLCEELSNRRVSFKDDPPAMPPDDYEPLDNLYIDAYVTACATIDGLSSIWEAIANPSTQPLGNQKRFTMFLEMLNVNRAFELVCTPFLFYVLSQQNIEQPYRDEIFRRWVEREDEYTGHAVNADPTVDELKDLYRQLSRGEIKNIDKTLYQFKYSSLVYKYYRCSFIHEFRASRYVDSFSRGEEISVRQWTSKPHPQIDIGLGVLTRAIRVGAAEMERLVLENNLTSIPYGRDDLIRIETN